ncbi:hypothetical protein FOL47_010280 [Perkinsus chesapeaki]|uniref:Cysteine protease n=1 Tax=Perkinsus chesapeaki TaxID=330153 RepID=A0A7J6L4J4_PERCH|nr:hypothetical protein FOL47_010280 [Perkinsus chesapeaki]
MYPAFKKAGGRLVRFYRPLTNRHGIVCLCSMVLADHSLAVVSLSRVTQSRCPLSGPENMMLLIFTTLLATTLAERNPAELKQMFTDYKAQYDIISFKLDFGEHDAEKEAIFRANVQYIEETNAKNLSYRLGINKFTHLTNDEFRSMMSLRGLVSYRASGLRSSGKSDRDVFKFTGSLDDLPKSVDWRKEGYVTPVKNQGQCGSCWAFSATGALEGLYKKMTGKLVSLSEQELVDCSDSFGNMGCGGGLMDCAFDYVEAKGLESENDYEYVAQGQSCKANGAEDVIKAGTIAHRDVDNDSVDSLMAALANNGPVSVAIEADTNIFQHYSGGVIDNPECGTDLDHGVLAVGYSTSGTSNDDVPYFIVKNSWGAGWGEGGYVRIALNGPTEGICGILKLPSYPRKA